MVWPQYALLITSVLLCFWMPETVLPDHYERGKHDGGGILMQAGFLQIGNGELTVRERIPNLAFEDFRDQALEIVENGGKVVHYFAYPNGKQLKLLAVLRNEHLLVARVRCT